MGKKSAIRIGNACLSGGFNLCLCTLVSVKDTRIQHPCFCERCHKVFTLLNVLGIHSKIRSLSDSPAIAC